MDNHHIAHWSKTVCFDIVKPHVALFCVPRFQWVVLRQDCLAHRASFKSKSDRCVPSVELQVKRQLVCTRSVRSRSNIHPKFRVLLFGSASSKSKLNSVVVNDDNLNSYFHCPGLAKIATHTKVVCSSRVPVSQGESLNDRAVTVKSAPASAYHKLASAIQIAHSASQDENKVS